MKKLLLTLALSLTATTAHARTPRPQVDTPDFAVEVCTSTTINLSNTATTNVIAASVALGSATFMEVYNADTASTINCGFDVGVSTTLADPSYGREVLARIGLGLMINLDKFTGYWCGTQKTSAATRAIITKCR